MTLMERARRFMGAKSHALALTAVPLAALVLVAAPAKASTIDTLTFNTGSCVVNTQGAVTFGSGSCGSSLNPSQNSANGVKLFGDAFVISSSGGTSGLSFDLIGTINGTYSGSLPLSWDFDVITSSPNALSYSLDFFFSGGASNISAGGCVANCITAGPAGTSTYHISGSDTLAISGAVSDYEILLSITQDLSPGDTLELNVPNHSVDINAASVSAPEPASFGIAATGLGALLLNRLRRRKA
jgi:hypothetical protein